MMQVIADRGPLGPVRACGLNSASRPCCCVESLTIAFSFPPLRPDTTSETQPSCVAFARCPNLVISRRRIRHPFAGPSSALEQTRAAREREAEQNETRDLPCQRPRANAALSFRRRHSSALLISPNRRIMVCDGYQSGIDNSPTAQNTPMRPFPRRWTGAREAPRPRHQSLASLPSQTCPAGTKWKYDLLSHVILLGPERLSANRTNRRGRLGVGIGPLWKRRLLASCGTSGGACA